jgi:hypothetical protein
MKYLKLVEGVVTDVFGAPQDPEVWPGLLEVEDDDPRYVQFIKPFEPDLALIAADTRDSLLVGASQAISPLLLALQLGNATDAETASAKAWQSYVRALKALDLTADPIAWPKQPA